MGAAAGYVWYGASVFSTSCGCVMRGTGFTHEVAQHFLEDALEHTGWQAPVRTVQDLGKPRWGNAKYRRERMKLKRNNPDDRTSELAATLQGCVSAAGTRVGRPALRRRLGVTLSGGVWSRYSPRTVASVAAVEADEDHIPLDLIVALLEMIDSKDTTGGAVLIFLPGWGDISKLYEALRSHRRVGARCCSKVRCSVSLTVPRPRRSFAAQRRFGCCLCMAACQLGTSGPYSRLRHVGYAKLSLPRTSRRQGGEGLAVVVHCNL